MKKLNETDLFEPIRNYLTGNGYKVNGEVKHCDMTAVKEDELVVIELKKGFNISLLIQAVNRQKFADSVYVAIPSGKNGSYPKNWKGVCNLLKRLELGLILVSFLKTRTRVDIIFHPSEYKLRRNHKARRNIIREISGRTGNHNMGGSRGKQIITAYRENVIHIASCLIRYGELSPSQLRKLGTSDKTQGILSNNYYGWFERIKRGVYRLHPEGKKAIKRYPDLEKHYKKLVNSIPEETL